MSETEDFSALWVCVVDDDRPSRALAARWLEHAGFRVLQAEDGRAALTMIEKNADVLGVILLDVMMPQLDGFEVLELVRKNPATALIPVVFLTAHATDEDYVVRGIEGGADEHLTKPFKGKVLVAKVRALYRRRLSQLGLDQRLRAAEALAFTDALTGLSNRRAFDPQLRVESTFSERHHQPFALLMLDLDYFKSVNDEFGHPEGDRVLKYVAECILRTMRGSDQAFRLGGEEFAILLRGCDREAGFRAASRFRDCIGKCEFAFSNGSSRLITTSVGVAFCDVSNDFRVANMLARADAALYRAKQLGRNRAELEFEGASQAPTSRFT
jgi:diguanylate cyclase (GGDEF)-like protein